MGLSVIGNGDFGIVSGPRWIPGGLLELDALEIVYQGAFNKLTTFRNGLTKWAASSIDSNMYLESFPDDGDGVMPKVTLRYIGCKGGTLPVPVTAQGGSLATATQTDGELQVSALYWSPHTQVTWIANNQQNNHGEFTNEAAIQILERRVNNHVPSSLLIQAKIQAQLTGVTLTPEQQAAIDNYLAALQAPIDAAKARVLAYFNKAFQQQNRVTEFEAEPLVPGKYWRSHCITAALLEPV